RHPRVLPGEGRGDGRQAQDGGGPDAGDEENRQLPRVDSSPGRMHAPLPPPGCPFPAPESPAGAGWAPAPARAAAASASGAAAQRYRPTPTIAWGSPAPGTAGQRNAARSGAG